MRFLAKRPAHLGRCAAAIIAVGVLLGGCASADKTTSTSSSTAASSGSSGSSASSGSGAMAGMSMGTTSTSAVVPSVDGIKPVPTQTLGTADWQGMKITAMAMTAVPFVIYDGTSEQMVKPTSQTSFHLMVMLNDAQTNVPIPYASVWATISKGWQGRLRRAAVADDLALHGPALRQRRLASGRRQLPAQPAGHRRRCRLATSSTRTSG